MNALPAIAALPLAALQLCAAVAHLGWFELYKLAAAVGSIERTSNALRD